MRRRNSKVERGIQEIVAKDGVTVLGYRVQVMTSDGKRKSQNYKSLTAARAGRARLKTAASDNTLTGATKMTVNEATADFLIHFGRLRRAKNTIHGYNSLFENHIKNHRLGSIRLHKLRPKDIEDFYFDLKKKQVNGRPLSDSMLKQVRNIITQTLNRAVVHHGLAINPCKGVKLDTGGGMKGTVRPSVSWDKKDISAFLNHHRRNRWHVFVRTALLLGLRNGELCGLHWEDIDWATNSIHIRRSRTNVAGKPTETTPKTASGQRTLRMSDQLARELRRHQASQNTEMQALGKPPSKYVFTSIKGEPLRIDVVGKRLKRMCIEAGVPTIHPHALRHTFATLAFEAPGVSIKAVSQLMGHTNAAFTLNRYGHSTQAGTSAVMTSVSAALEEEEQEQAELSGDEQGEIE